MAQQRDSYKVVDRCLKLSSHLLACRKGEVSEIQQSYFSCHNQEPSKSISEADKHECVWCPALHGGSICRCEAASMVLKLMQNCGSTGPKHAVYVLS